MNDIALLISTFDSSEDLWSPLEKTYVKFWSDISMPIYLTTNHKEFSGELFTALKIGGELSWSDNLIKSLNKIDEKYIFLTFDDLFLTAKVDNTKIEELMFHAIENDFNYLQFYRSISLGKRIRKDLFKKNSATKYRNSTVWSFWKKEVLLDLLEKNENAWEFEKVGNLRSQKYNNFYSTRKNIIPFVNGVVKGKWEGLAKKRIKNFGIQIDEKRSSLTFIQMLYYHFKNTQFDILTYLIHKIY